MQVFIGYVHFRKKKLTGTINLNTNKQINFIYDEEIL